MQNAAGMSLDRVHLTIGTKRICTNLSLKVSAGMMVGLIGPNGCGKTTLLRAFANLHPLKKGTITINDFPIKTLRSKLRAQQVGILFQDTSFTFAQTVYDYCATARFPHTRYYQALNKADNAIIENALTVCDLLSKAHHSILALSGGEKRRLQIACVIAQSPKIFLLDEPTNHLDLAHQIQILTYFKQLEHKIVWVALHDINLAYRYCDKVLCLYPDGEVDFGEPAIIFQSAKLSKLYQHPIAQLSRDGKVFWYPESL